MGWRGFITKLVSALPNIVRSVRRIREASRRQGSESLDALREPSKLQREINFAKLNAVARARAARKARRDN